MEITEFDTDWAIMLNDMRPTWTDDEGVRRARTEEIRNYVAEQSQGAFELDKYTGRITQLKAMNWSTIFDVIKNADLFGFTIWMEIPSSLNVKKTSPALGSMYACYKAEEDAVRVRAETGKRREDLSGYDGWGRGPDEFEVVQGFLDRDGQWLEPLHLTWV